MPPAYLHTHYGVPFFTRDREKQRKGIIRNDIAESFVFVGVNGKVKTCRVSDDRPRENESGRQSRTPVLEKLLPEQVRDTDLLYNRSGPGAFDE